VSLAQVYEGPFNMGAVEAQHLVYKSPLALHTHGYPQPQDAGVEIYSLFQVFDYEAGVKERLQHK
jgi:hypothetical protein